MKIKKLEITGFKSFLTRTGIEFPPGISAIVGPNGCGKSNIMDALRWAMGEQSVKQLRGKAMEDIIFSGANGTNPVNMAEVSLTLSNDNGSAPEEFKDFTEIMLTRRLYRSGDSAYFINKQAARLKDIHNIFLGSGMGSKSYAVIQQGNIGAITDAGPDERRMFIEEAAGVTRYKQRKKEALQKVDLTNQNLLRVKDIISEIERQMNSLKRQAKKAQVYQNYKAIIRKLDILQTVYFYDTYSKEIEHADSLLASLKGSDLEDTTRLHQLNAAIEEIKLKRFEKKQEISEQQSQKFGLQRDLDRTENDLSHLRTDQKRLVEEIHQLEQERHDLEHKETDIQNEILHLNQQHEQLLTDISRVEKSLAREQLSSQSTQSRFSDLTRQLETNKTELMDLATQEARYNNIYQNTTSTKENLKHRLKRIDEQELIARKKVSQIESQNDQLAVQLDKNQKELDGLSKRASQAEMELNRGKQELQKHIKALQAIELEHGKLKAKYATLKKMETSLQWYKDGVKAVVKSEELHGILGLIADMIEPEPSYESAVEAALGEILQYVLVNDPMDAQQAVRYLKSHAKGRCGFIVSSHCDPGAEAAMEQAGLEPSRLLKNHVSVKPGFESAAASWLNHVIVVNTLQEAFGIIHSLSKPWTVVTREGDVISDRGVMVGGSKDNLDGILLKKQEIREIEFQVSDLNEQLQSSRQVLKELESVLRSGEQALQKLIESKSRIARERIEAEKHLFKVQEELKHCRHHLEILQLEQEQLQGEEFDLDDEISRSSQNLHQLTDRIMEAQNRVTGLSSEIEHLSSDLASYNQKVLDLKVELTSLNAKCDNIVSTLNRLQEFRNDGIKRLEHLAVDIENRKSQARHSSQKAEALSSTLAHRYDELKLLEESLSRDESAYQEIDSALKQNDQVISELQNRREETLKNIRVLEIERTQKVIKRDGLANQIEDRYHDSFETLRKQFRTAWEDPGFSIEDNEKQLSDYKSRITKLTDVNLGAIKEYEQLKSRFDFLTEQHNDLVKAIGDLHKVIKKINRITQQKFTETLLQINDKLQEVFPLLFGGGTAQLILTDPDDPLESGVEFMIHPPGKKLTRLSLLSGGEKALSAIAFIFSIFLIKPSSFCLLDEIDAPLDEANVIKFNHMIKSIGENSQVIMITHNKRSMECADSLFGITMEQKGISKLVSVNLERLNNTLH